MSFIDSRWVIWDGQALTSAEKSHTNGTLIDLEENGVTDEQIADLWFILSINTLFAGLDSGCSFAIITSDSATFASGNKCIASFGEANYPIGVAEMTAGAQWCINVHYSGCHKYLGVAFTPVSEAASAGKVDLFCLLNPVDPPKIQKYPDGYS